MSTTYYRFKRDIKSEDNTEWWRTHSDRPVGQQVEWSSDGGATWNRSILATENDFVWDADGNAVQVDPPAVGSRRDGDQAGLPEGGGSGA